MNFYLNKIILDNLQDVDVIVVRIVVAVVTSRKSKHGKKRIETIMKMEK